MAKRDRPGAKSRLKLGQDSVEGRSLSLFESRWLDDRTMLDRWLSPFRLKAAFWSVVVLMVLISPVIWLDADLWFPISLSLGLLVSPVLYVFWVVLTPESWKTSKVEPRRGVVEYMEARKKGGRRRTPTLDGIRPLVVPEGWEDDFPQGAFVEIEAFEAPSPGRVEGFASAWWVVSLRGRRSIDAESTAGCFHSRSVPSWAWWLAGVVFPILFGCSLFLLPAGVGLRQVPGILANTEIAEVRDEAALRKLAPGPGRALRLGNVAEIEQPDAAWSRLVFLPESTSTEPIARRVWWIRPDLLAIPTRVEEWDERGRIEAVFLRDSSSRNPWVCDPEAEAGGPVDKSMESMDRIWRVATWWKRPDPILNGGGLGFDADFVEGEGAFAVTVRKSSLVAQWREAADRLMSTSRSKATTGFSIWRVDSTRIPRGTLSRGFRLEGGIDAWTGNLARMSDRIVSVRVRLPGQLLVADGFDSPVRVHPCVTAWVFLALAFFAWVGAGIVRQMDLPKTKAKAREASLAFWAKEGG